MNLLEKILGDYGFNKKDFAIIQVPVHRDRMNDGFYETEMEYVAVPKKFKHKVEYVTVDFQMQDCRFFDKNNNSLFTTVGLGYDEFVTPIAFFLSDFFPTLEKNMA